MNEETKKNHDMTEFRSFSDETIHILTKQLGKEKAEHLLQKSDPAQTLPLPTEDNKNNIEE